LIYSTQLQLSDKLVTTIAAMTLLSILLAAMTIYTAAKSTVTYRPIQYAIMFLLAVTSAMHIYLGVLGDTLLLLNGVGYYILLLALYWPIEQTQKWRRLLSWILVLYTSVTIIGYFVVHVEMYPHFDRIGLFNKAVELLLLVLMCIQMGRRRYLGVPFVFGADSATTE
jgi:hypothetical protein